MRALLISTYDLGRQPWGLASPAAWLRQRGVETTCRDVAVESLREEEIRGADLIAFYLPMHTATRLAVELLPRVRALAPEAHLCAYGLYAPVNEDLLRAGGVDTILGGEYEASLATLARGIDAGAVRAETRVDLGRLDFRVPDRSDLPAPRHYAHVRFPDGDHRVAGSTMASRGCKHLCRHCPIVPVYEGRFRVVSPEVVLADVDAQVEAGAEHVTFGDPDFLNGPRHALEVVRRLHDRHPGLSYDVTVKVEHLVDHAELLPELRRTGCAFVVSAVESLDDRVLRILDKGHTRDDFLQALQATGSAGLPLQPTFVAFHPWLTLEDYRDLVATLARLGLAGAVAPVQLAIRLLIPAGSRLLELPDVRRRVGAFDPGALAHPWEHADPRVDRLHREMESVVADLDDEPAARREVLGTAWRAVHRLLGDPAPSLPQVAPGRDPVTVPYLTEPWYC